MNLQEFAALRVGDKVSNPMGGSHGTVSRVIGGGVYVQWGHTQTTEKEFFYSVQGTAWFHWTKAEAPQERNPANCEHGVAMDIFCELCEPAK